MGIIDRIVETVSPQKAYEREMWRQSLDNARSYDAASYGRLNSGWRVINESAELTDRNNRDIVRARGRDMERNSDMTQSIILAFDRNVVGKGYTLQAQTGDNNLDDFIEQQWKIWCKAKNCDVTGTQSFNQICHMAERRKKVDGGMLLVRRYTSGGPVPLKLQAMEVDELATDQTTPKNKNNRVVGGIEYNRYNRAVGYYIRQYDIEGWRILDPVYVPAKDVIFIWSKNRPSQLREMSDLTPTITRIRDTNEFITAVSVKERIAACLAVFIKKITPTGGHGREYNARTPGGGIDYTGKKLTPGMITELNAGDDVHVVDPKSAGSDAAQMLKLQQGLIGAGQGLSYEAISRDMSQATYSSARQGTIEDDGTYSNDIELLTELMTEVYESFIISGYLSGLFKMPDFWERKDEYLNHYWVKAPKRWIDPLKESNANRIAMQTGQKTFPEICAEQGRDWKETIDEIAEVLEYGRENGIEMGGVIFGQGTTAAQQNTPKGK